MMNVLNLIWQLGLLVILILSLVGAGYLTPLAFGTKNYNNLTKTQQNLCKMFIVLVWIGVLLSILGVIASFFGYGTKKM
jgi:hypothetical protein